MSPKCGQTNIPHRPNFRPTRNIECYRCGRVGHEWGRCYAKYGVDGKPFKLMYPSARDRKMKHVPQHVGGFRYGHRKGHVNANFDNKVGHKQPRQNDIQNGKPLIELNLIYHNQIPSLLL